MRQPTARRLLALSLCLGVLATVTPVGPMAVSAGTRVVSSATGLSWRTSGSVFEPAANVVLFVPLALLLCWAAPQLRPPLVWAFWTAVSVGVEVTQAAFLSERHPSLLDVAMNGTGALLGVLLHRRLDRRARSTRARPVD